MDEKDGKFTWNYRFVNTPAENDGKDWITLKEVHYDADGKLLGFGDPCVGADNIDDVQWLTDRWVQAAMEPVLREDEFK